MDNTISYYDYEGIPCQVTKNGETAAISAEGYFPGKGLRPVEVTAILFHGAPITEKEFRALVVSSLKK